MKEEIKTGDWIILRDPTQSWKDITQGKVYKAGTIIDDDEMYVKEDTGVDCKWGTCYWRKARPEEIPLTSVRSFTSSHNDEQITGYQVIKAYPGFKSGDVIKSRTTMTVINAEGFMTQQALKDYPEFFKPIYEIKKFRLQQTNGKSFEVKMLDQSVETEDKRIITLTVLKDLLDNIYRASTTVTTRNGTDYLVKVEYVTIGCKSSVSVSSIIELVKLLEYKYNS
jgi:hypothetical protein